MISRTEIAKAEKNRSTLANWYKKQEICIQLFKVPKKSGSKKYKIS